MDKENTEIKTCRCCGEEIGWNNVATPEGWAEVEITSTCEVCFDDMFFDLDLEAFFEFSVDDYPIIEDILNTEGVYLAGGFLRTLVDPQDEIQDIDIFFRNKQIAEKFKQEMIDNGYSLIFSCPKGELFSFRDENDTKIQLITKFYYEDVDQLINSFDITACCVATEDGVNLVKHRRFIFDVLNKRLNINKVTFPVATLSRIMKYKDKGFTMSGKASTEYVTQVNMMTLDETNMALYVD